MFIYDDIAFRVIERADLEILRSLHNDESTFLNLLNIDLADEQSQTSWWEGLHKKKDDKRYVVCLSDKPEIVIGRLRVQNINYLHNNCEVGLDILSEYRGKGFGLKSYKMLLKFLFNHLNMNMVYLKVADFNPAAKRLYQKVGFYETGRLPQFFYRHGKYWDYVIMCLTKSDYLAQLPKIAKSS